ncbi:MAG: aspartate aminotransferase family protein [Akkermansiaceae bacterium]|jgi:4-aminobutyrate aminotransferase-like enzyme|nr:aspartate aminotransferase family protein [Luteolibacter sp.]
MLPKIYTNVPGERSLAWGKRLGEVECRNTTYLAEDWPIFWERADGVNVWDVDGNRFLDMTSGFGVAGLGYGFTAEALRRQSDVLLHAMGDVHPARVKVELCEVLSKITYEKWEDKKGKCLFGNSGFEAVEAALKTAVLATGRAGILSFEGGYHGLGYGALLGQGIGWFREPFEGQIAKVTQRLKFPREEEGLDDFLEQLTKVDGSKIGAVLVEPIQGRGGIVVPPEGFLAALREWCNKVGAVLIFDEIYTGFWRTGKMFACEWDNKAREDSRGSVVVPDLICLGKALSGGFPISVCVGRAEVMDAWPESGGEALHTSTFLGNPMGCAMALEAIRRYQETETESLVREAAEKLESGLRKLESLGMVKEVRGRGLMMGVEMDCGERVLDLTKALLREGVIVLPDGPKGDVLALTPPLGISSEEIDFSMELLRNLIEF